MVALHALFVLRRSSHRVSYMLDLTSLPDSTHCQMEEAGARVEVCDELGFLSMELGSSRARSLGQLVQEVVRVEVALAKPLQGLAESNDSAWSNVIAAFEAVCGPKVGAGALGDGFE